MGRSKIYENDAERKKAYRLRLSGQQSQPQHPPPSPARSRPPSRPQRLARALSEVEALQAEFEGWLSAMPESLQGSGLADRLQETIEKLAQAVELLAEMELPKGFGRD
jgi:hypothetical protein